MAAPAAAPAGVPVWNPEGELVTIPAFDQAAAMHGYRPATPEDVHQAQVEEKYGGFGQGVAAAAEGAASALTFGISPKIETATGLTTPEAIEGRKEVHPVPHAIGTGIGIVAPLLATAGAAAPAEAAGQLGARAAIRGAAEFTAPALIARAGKAAVGVAERAGLPGAVGRLAPVVAAGVTEGALYAGADVTEKALLGDPSLTWEKAATEVGLGGLFGGALSGGTGLAAKGIGKLLTKATAGLESVAERIASGDQATVKLMLNAKHQIAELAKAVPDAAESIAGASPETAKFILRNLDRIKEMEKGFPGLTDVLARGDPDTGAEIMRLWNQLLRDPQRRIEVGTALLDTTQSSYSTIETALGKFNREVRPEEAESLLFGPHTVEIPGGGSALEVVPQAEAAAEGQRVLNQIGGKINKMRAEPDLYEASYARDLELFRDGMVRQLVDDPTPSGIFQRLRLLRQQLDGDIPWNRTASGLAERKAISEFKNLRFSVGESLHGQTWGQAGVRQKALDVAYKDYFDARKVMLKRLGEGEGTAKNISATKVNAWVNAMADMRGKVKSDAFTDFADSARRLAAEMETSGLPEASAIRQQIDRAVATAKDIRERAAVTQLVKMAQGREIMSSGPAVPMGHQMALAAAKRIPGGVGHIVGGISGVITKARQPSVMVGVLSALDKLAKKASAKLEAGADGIFSSGVGGAAAGEAAEKFAHGGMVAPEKYADVSTHLRHLGGNLDALASDIARETAGLQEHAPGTATAAHAFAARVVQHLGSKLPDPGQRQLLDPPFEPSASELSDYNRHHEIAVRGPVAVLEHVSRGTLHEDHLAASAAMYPRLHAEAQQLVTERLAEHLAAKKHVPLALREPLGMFLGMDLDHASTGAAILSAQQAFASPAAAQAPSAGGPKSGKSRQVETHFDDRTATPTQGNQSRMRREV